MTALRVLVVDDSVVARRLIAEVLQSQADIEVTGVAASATIALQKIAQVAPDLVLLDLDMPDVDGIECMARIRDLCPELPVVMVSAFTEPGAEATLRAMSAGASDYVTKPSALTNLADFASFRTDLLDKVRSYGGARAPRWSVPPAPRPRPASAKRGPIAAIGIGCSTGGPNALALVFAALVKPLPVPIFITQHMPPMFTRLLAERLTASTGYDVVEATDDALVVAGRAYVAPGNFHMGVVRRGGVARIALNQDAPESSCRPAVDVMFRSLAKAYGEAALGVVLTGMGHDGARGAERLFEVGAEILLQSAESCVVPTMRNAVAAALTPTGVHTIDRLGYELASRVALRERGGAS